MIRRDEYYIRPKYRHLDNKAKRRADRRERIRDAMEYIPYLAGSVGLLMAAMWLGNDMGTNAMAFIEAAMRGEIDPSSILGEDDGTGAKWVTVPQTLKPWTWELF